ncbi:MAG: hypothetical protein ACQGVC_19805 [Myxococcota bacterium]
MTRWAAFGLALILAAAATAEGRVHPDPQSVEPLAVGARVPSATVRSVEGEPVDLAGVVKDAGALLVFYRGGW